MTQMLIAALMLALVASLLIIRRKRADRSITYAAIAIATMMVLAARQYRSNHGIHRLPAALLTLGSAFGVMLCLAVLTMDIAHTTGQIALMRAVQPIYSPLSLLTFLLL